MKKTERLTIRVTENTKSKLEELAARDDRSINYYVNKLLEQHIAQQKEKPTTKT